MLFNYLSYYRRFLFSFLPRKTQEHYARADPAQAEKQFSEIFITGEKQRVSIMRDSEDFIIRNAWIHFGDIFNRMPVFSQSIDDLPINIFIGKQIHAAFFARG